MKIPRGDIVPKRVPKRKVGFIEMFPISWRERWVLLKIPRCDIDGVGEVK